MSSREQFCVECGDQPATVFCKQCKDQYCEVCFGAQHRKGNRFRHEWQDLKDDSKLKGGSTQQPIPEIEMKQSKDEKLQLTDIKEKKEKEDADLIALDDMAQAKSEWFSEDPTPQWFAERSKWIPLRLSEDERIILNLIENCLDVSEYTDKIDVFSYHGKEKRIQSQLLDVCGIIAGLRIAADYASGKKLFKDKSIKSNEAFYQWAFEIARRHKIRNPEKMRTEYGKLMFLLQDSQMSEIQERLGFALVKKIVTVHSFLSEKKCLELLGDKLMALATGEIISEGKVRTDIDKLVKAKQDAIKRLSQKYKKDDLSEEEVKLCILSIGDNHSFLRSNRDVVDQMMAYLQKYYNPDTANKPWSLAIKAGQRGSCLSHDHRTQFFFALQSLTLWRDILHDMFRLWYLSEQDLLDPGNQYRLRNTGQGLNRMQNCPRIGRAMSEIVGKCHHKMGRWVGLSVVHLGDVDVPNALVFIDKYNQVSRILTPIATCIRDLEKLYSVPQLKRWIDKIFGGLEKLRMEILTDFFRHAFDGSGSDGGSCIDGRLTSCWNWCSKLEKKSYYPIFLLTGFVGFDGNF